jgi:hypothetical protein
MAMWMLARERLGRELYEALGYALASRAPGAGGESSLVAARVV